MARFSLTKWYLDCITDTGAAAIAYVAQLAWGSVVMRYASVLTCDTAGTVRQRTTLRDVEMPEVDGDRISWSSRPLGVGGVWIARKPAIERRLLETAEGAVEWRCLQPLAQVEIGIENGKLVGAGYAERLELSIAPWSLPIETLRWGRAVFADRAIVWIDWRGERNLHHVFDDGHDTSVSFDGDHALRSGTWTLNMREPTVLRQGPIIGTALARIPGVDKLFPVRALWIDERKWLSACELREGTSTLCGRAIHEVVRWPP